FGFDPLICSKGDLVASSVTSQKQVHRMWIQTWSVRSDRPRSETGVTYSTFVTVLPNFSSEMPSQEKRKQEACERARPENQAEDQDILRKKKNIVRFIDSFRYHHHSCLAFEMLDMSLWDLVNKREWEPLSLNEIRPVTRQLLVAFEALESIGIMHTDLKPDNVMLVNHKDQPFRIKLIDFGLAIHTSEAKIGMRMQATSYRAPEVNLGLPLTESVDMWALGCVMAFLYFGANLFPGSCPYHWMKTVVHLVGQKGQSV
uniref:Protein kinase domain-containing protein n=1 Tax=Echeneis naucrates TaxID=173247 RepID=A0A665UIN9_ECHNA